MSLTQTLPALSLLDLAEFSPPPPRPRPSAPFAPSSPTSVAACPSPPQVSKQEGKVLACLRDHGPLIRDEIALLAGVPPSSVCARVNRLIEDGLLEQTEETRATRYGKQGAVVRIVPGATWSEKASKGR